MNTLRNASPLDLTEQELCTWHALATDVPRFQTPFLHPEYARAMARFRPQVEVAVLSNGVGPNGFFAYERHGNSAKPLGIKLADFQGVVASDECHCDASTLLTSTRLSASEFDHLLADDAVFAGSSVRVDESPYMDLSTGMDTYLESMKSKGSGLISQVQRKQRKLEREVGSIEFTWHDLDDAAWQLLLDWKSAQRARTKTVNILAFPWVCEFLRHMLHIDEQGLRGVMSTLRVNGRVIAVHLGMCTPRRLHYWFPAYDPEFGRYSPGLILLLMIARQACDSGITRIDLGKGDDGYKSSFASGADPVATAFADRWVTRWLVRSCLFRLQTWIKTSPLKTAMQLPKRLIRRWQAQATMG